MKNKQLKALLKTDPIQIAEDITGQSYKENESVGLLGLGLSILHNAKVNKALTDRGDSTLSNELKKYQEIIQSIGFKLAVEIPFTAPGWNSDDPDKNEKLFVYANSEKGIVLVFDTYDGVRVNGGSYYYAWKPKKGLENSFCVTSSGGWESISEKDWRHNPKYLNKSPSDLFWFGSHDCRQAVKFNISQLEENGSFYPVWPETTKGMNSRTMFTHYQDWKHPSYENAKWEIQDAFLDQLFKDRLAQLPGWAKAIMNEAV